MTQVTHDTKGRAYLKLSEAKAGQLVETDEGFTCIGKQEVKLIAGKHIGGRSNLYFCCSDGAHYIDGQADDGEHCIGIYEVQP